MTTPTLSWQGKVGHAVGVLCLFGLLPLAAYTMGPLGGTVVLILYLVLLIEIGTVLKFTLEHYQGKVGTNPRVADDPERTEYARLCAEHGVPVGDVWLVDELDWSYGLAEVWGLVPGNRHLFLEKEFFDAYSGNERTAAVLQEVSLADDYYRFFGTLLAAHAVVATFVVVRVGTVITGSTTPFASVPGAPWLVFGLLLVLGAWYSRRKVYRADRLAAEQTDEETVVSVLESLEDVKREDDREWLETRVLSLLWTRPSPEKRIERLRG